jgi:hypothetical protein
MLSGLKTTRVSWIPPMVKRERTREMAAFGRLLRALRVRRFKGKLTPEKVADQLRARGIQTTGGSIRGYEAGWNKGMDPVVLYGLADLYKVGLSGLILALAANRKNPNLSDFELEQVLREARRDQDAQTVTTARFEEIARRLQAVSTELVVITAEATELVDDDDEPGGQAAEARDSAPPHDPDH